MFAPMNQFLKELRRRRVFRTAAVYIVAAWVAIQVASEAFPGLGIAESAIRFVWIGAFLGFPVALIFSWIYEITPDGITHTPPSDPDAAPDLSLHRMDYLILGALGVVVVAVTYGLVGEIRELEILEPGVQPTAPLVLGVAVLPFDNLSEDAGNAFFASGVHEDVLTYLSRVVDLRVISRTSMLKIAETDLDVPAIGERLGVSHVLEGSVRRAGDRVRITVQLIDAATDEHVWADNYDRTLDDIFAIQTEIAQTIVARLEAALTPEEAASLADFPTTSIEAYDAYLRARERRNTAFTVAGRTDRAGIIDQLLRATELDPGFIEAWLLLVEISSHAVFNSTEVDLNRTHASDALARIRALAPDSPESDLATGIYLYWVEYDLEQALAALERAVAARPNDRTALNMLAWVARRLKRWDMAVAAARQAVLVDPASAEAHIALITILTARLEVSAAIGAAAEAARRFPESVIFRVRHADLIARHTGNVAPFREVIDVVPPSYRMVIWDAALLQGVFDDTEAVIAWFDAVDPDEHPRFRNFSNYVIGSYLLVNGDRQRAQVFFEESYSAFIAFHDAMDDAQRPRFFARRGWGAALVGDRETALEYRERGLAYAAASNDIQRANFTRFAAAMVLAVLGDADAAWRELEPLIGVRGGPTQWELATLITARHFLADSEGYQAMLAELGADE